MWKSLISLCLLLSFSIQARATHVMGADITYTNDSDYVYTFTITYYRDCRGVSFSNPSSATSIRCLTGGSASVALSLVSISEVTPLCIYQTAKCNPANTYGTGEGIEKHVYRATVDFNTAPYNTLKSCCRIIIQTGQCCRNSAINTGASNQNFYTYAELNLCKAPDNNSPQFISEPYSILCCNQPYYGTMGCTDAIDRDSLVFKWANPLSGWNQNIGYSGTYYAYNHPFRPYYPGSLTPPYNNPNTSPPIGIYLNSETGDVILTPARCDEVTVAVMAVEEWRKNSSGTYELIGVTRRDMQFITKTCPDNNPPYINGPYSYTYNMDRCDEPVSFTITAGDNVFTPPPPNPAPAPDTTRFVINSLPPGFSYEILDPDSLRPKCKITIDPFYVTPSSLPYTFLVQVRDNACPLNAVTSRTFRVYMNLSDSSGLASGVVILDSNANCAMDGTDDSLTIRRTIKHGSYRYRYTETEPDGTFQFCMQLDTNTIELVPHPYFDDVCGDTMLVVDHDSTYPNIQLFTSLKDGLMGYVKRGFDSLCTTNGPAFPNLMLVATPGPYYTTTDKDGFYLFELPADTYTIKPLFDSSLFENVCTDSIVATADSNSTKWVNSFVIQAKPVIDAEVFAGNSWGNRIRKGSYTRLTASIHNKSNTSLDSVDLYISLDSKFTGYHTHTNSSSGWTVVGANTYKRRIYNLSTNETRGYYLYAYCSSTAPTNSSACFTVETDTAFTFIDRYWPDNTDTKCLRVVTGYDPNIKTTEEDSLFTTTNRRLTYTIQFQNTGNSPVTTVNLRDTLPEEFDLSTFRVEGATHPYQYILNGRHLWVVFDWIELPDSASNADSSVGSFSFSIALKEGIFETTELKNRAGIYFDFEEVVLTPYQHNTFVSPTVLLKDSLGKVCSRDSIYVPFQAHFAPDSNTTFILELSDSTGSFAQPQVVAMLQDTNRVDSFLWVIDESISTGSYRLRISSVQPGSESFETAWSDTFQIRSIPKPTIQLSATEFCYGTEILVHSNWDADSAKLYIGGQLYGSAQNDSFTLTDLMDQDLIHLHLFDGGCDALSDTALVAVYAVPHVQLNSDSVLCAGQFTLDFEREDSLSPGQGSLASLFWNFGDGSVSYRDTTQPDPSHTYAVGSYTLSIIASTDRGCKDTLTQTITIGDRPDLSIQLSKDSICLSDADISLSFSDAGTAALDSVQWDLGDGNSSALNSLIHSYTAAGSYTIALIATDVHACSDTATRVLLVAPNAQAVVLVDAAQCAYENDFHFISQYANADQSSAWTIDGISYSTDSVHVSFGSDGTYGYTLITTHLLGCADTTSGTVALHPVEPAVWSLGIEQCERDLVLLNFNPQLSGGSHWWTASGNTYTNGQSMDLQPAGNLDIVFTTRTAYGCLDSTAITVNILPRPLADFSATDHCQGTPTIFSNSSSNYIAASTFSWDFGDGNSTSGSFQATEPHSYGAAGSYSVRLIGTTGPCADTLIKPLQIYPLPVADFDVSTGGSSSYARLLSNKSSGQLSSEWSIDGKTFIDNAPVLEYDFMANGEFTVKLVVSTDKGCLDSMERLVLVIGDIVFHIPNAYSPNSDGHNDLYRIKPTNLIGSLNFKVYSRWGQLVSESTDPNNLIPESLSDGIYLYVLDITDIYGGEHHFSDLLRVLK